MLQLNATEAPLKQQSRPHGLLVTNLTDNELPVLTNGQVVAVVVYLCPGEVIGGSTGAQALPLVVFRCYRARPKGCRY
jgi:hypothetical protein